MKNLISIAAQLYLLLLISSINGQWVETGGLAGISTRALAVNGGALFAGTDKGVFLSTNNGNTWTAVNNGLVKDTVVCLAVSGQALLAGTLHSGMFISTNNGALWTAVNKGLPYDPLDTNFYARVNDIAASDSGLFASIFQRGVFFSRNGGALWSEKNTGLAKNDVYSLAVNGRQLFAGTGAGGGVFVSSDNGASWNAVNNGLTYMPDMVYSVYTLASCSGRLFAGTLSGGVYRTMDNGESWTDANNGLSASIVHSLYAHDGDLYAGTGNNGVFLSADYGASWISISVGLPGNDAVLSLCVTGGSIYAGLYGGGVWRRPLVTTPPAPTNVAMEKSFKSNVFGVSDASGVLRYNLPAANRVSVRYYNLAGKLSDSFEKDYQAPGNYSLPLPSLAPGFYLRDFRAGSFIQKDRVTILR